MNFIEFTQTVILGGGATVLATQILKSGLIPVQFENYPRVTAAVISLISAGIAVYHANGTIFTTGGLVNWLTAGAATVIVAAVTYNTFIKEQANSLTKY